MLDTTTFDEMRTRAIREEILDQQLVQQARMIPPINYLTVGSYALPAPTITHSNQSFVVAGNAQTPTAPAQVFKVPVDPSTSRPNFTPRASSYNGRNSTPSNRAPRQQNPGHGFGASSGPASSEFPHSSPASLLALRPSMHENAYTPNVCCTEYGVPEVSMDRTIGDQGAIK